MIIAGEKDRDKKGAALRTSRVRLDVDSEGAGWDPTQSVANAYDGQGRDIGPAIGFH